MKNTQEEMSAGNVEIARSQSDRTVRACAVNFRHARFRKRERRILEREFCVIARARRSVQLFRRRQKSREQHGGIYLRDGHWHFVFDGGFPPRI